MQILHPAGVHQDIIQIPEIYVRQVAGKDPLHFSVNFFALVLIELTAALRDQSVNLRIAVVTAVGAPGREAAAGEDSFKNVGVLIAADPAQRIKLEGSFGHVGIKGGELHGTNVELDAYRAQLLL